MTDRERRIRPMPLVFALLGVAGIALGFYITGTLRNNGAAARVAAARAALASGNLAVAEEISVEGLKVDDTNTELHLVRARVFAAREDWSAAVGSFGLGKAVLKQAEDRQVFAGALMRLERWDAAIDVLAALANDSPNMPTVLDDLTACYIKQGMLDDALDSAHRLARLESGEVRGHWHLAVTYQLRDNLLDAAEHYFLALDANGTSKATDDARPFHANAVRRDLGEMLLRDGRALKAIQPLNELAGDSGTSEDYWLLGRAYAESNQLETAIQHWESALDALDNGQTIDTPQESDHRLETKTEFLTRALRAELARALLQIGKPAESEEALKPLEEASKYDAELAYLNYRTYSALAAKGADTAAASDAERWGRVCGYLRRWEFARSQVTAGPPERRDYWEQVLYCHQLAFQKEWKLAGSLAKKLSQGYPSEFVLALLESIDARQAPPPLETLGNEVL